MESNDIRERYDFEGKDTGVAAAFLDSRPPLWKGHAKSSGLDCLIVVIRSIYSNFMLSPGVSNELGWVQNSETQNPILGHAWHVFGDLPDEMKRTTDDRNEVERALVSLGVDPKASFETLCTSTLMSKTFWAQDVFRLSRPPVDAATGEPIQLTPDEIMTLSTLEFNRSQSPNSRLQDIADKAFGVHTRNGVDMVLVPNNPWVVRVLYRADSSDGSLDINKLKVMHLPIWRESERTFDMCPVKAGETSYFLFAVVRLREESPTDLVRTYDAAGANVHYAYEPTSFVCKHWSIKEAPHTYALFYSRLDVDLGLTDPTGFPEVAQPMELNHELIESVEDMLNSLKPVVPPPAPGSAAFQPPAGANRVRPEPDDLLYTSSEGVKRPILRAMSQSAFAGRRRDRFTAEFGDHNTN